MNDTFTEVRDLIVEVLKVDASEVKIDTRFIEDLRADSMDQFFLIDGLGEKFGIEISDEAARNIKTVADAVNFVDKNKK